MMMKGLGTYMKGLGTYMKVLGTYLYDADLGDSGIQKLSTVCHEEIFF